MESFGALDRSVFIPAVCTLSSNICEVNLVYRLFFPFFLGLRKELITQLVNVRGINLDVRQNIFLCLFLALRVRMAMPAKKLMPSFIGLSWS